MGQAIRRAAALAAAIAALAALAAPAFAADQRPDYITAFVAPGSKTDAKGGYYAIDARAGSSITQTVIVRNDRPRPLVADVEAVDAHTSAATGAAYDPPGTQPSGTGTWIVVTTSELTLQPGEQRSVDFTVNVPAGTKPGVYLAGISAAVPLPKNTTTSTVDRQHATFKITLQPQRLIAVQITVPGPREPKLVVTGARATAGQDGVALVVGIANRGNDFARGTGTITVGDTGLRKSFKIDTFIPGTQIQYRVPWTRDVVPGNHAVSVRLRYGGGNVTNWDGTADINGSARAKLESDLAKNRLPVSGGGALPWPLIAAGFAALLLCAGGVVVLRRRRREPQVISATVS
jgi:hypothetical protein